MESPLRFVGRSFVLLCAGASVACAPPPPPPMEDASTVDRAPCVGAACRDGAAGSDADAGTIMDVVAMDADDASSDGGSGSDPDAAVDGSTADVAVVVGRCTGVMAMPVTLGDEPRQQSRKVFVGQNQAGFYAGYTIQAGGADVVRFHRISTAGASAGSLDVAPDFWARAWAAARSR